MKKNSRPKKNRAENQEKMQAKRPRTGRKPAGKMPGKFMRRKKGPAKVKGIQPGSDRSLHRIFKEIGIPKKTPFVPDPFQLEAIEAIQSSDCLVTAPTGAGKTWIAQQVARQTLDKGGSVWYATPLKALSNSIHAQFCQIFGAENVGILTGDIKENTDAPIVIGTTEILRNQLYDAMYTGQNLKCNVIILDEAHYLGDEQRGVVWEEIIIYLPERIPLLMLSATIGNPEHISGWLESIRTRPCKIIASTDRPVPLHPLFMHPSGTLFPLLQQQEQSPKLHKKVYNFSKERKPQLMAPPGKLPPFDQILEVLDHYDLLPAIFFLKSRAECDQALRLCRSGLMDKRPERKQALCEHLDKLVKDFPHLDGHGHRHLLEKTGCAAHHSGLLPAWKVVVETLMAKGLLYAMFATSTVAAGVNFPARSVVVLNSDRFNGMDFLPLTPSEFQQMSGRAGRRGMDNVGFCLFLPGKFMDLKYVGKLVHANPLDVDSQIQINFSMVLNLLLSNSPEQIRLLLEKSFASYQMTHGRKKGKTARKKFGNELEYLWEDFLDHMDFLVDKNFVTEDGRLTEDGLWASKLRIDAPLLVAQSLRQKLFPSEDAAVLAAMMASFVNEKEFKDDPLFNQALPQTVKETFLGIRKGLKPFAMELLAGGFSAPNLFIQPAVQMYRWAHGEDWENLTGSSEFSDGDFARLIVRTGENLRQLSKLSDTFPEIAQAAKDAMAQILKEPVVTSPI